MNPDQMSASFEKKLVAQKRKEEDDQSHSLCLDSPMVVRFVPTRTSPRLIVHHIPTNTYAVIVGRKVEIPSMEMTTDRSLAIYEEKHELLLFSPESWEPIGRFDAFQEHEVVLCMDCLKLNDIVCLVIGTGIPLGEDMMCRGRIILIELTFAMGVMQSEGRKSQTKRMLKLKSIIQKCGGPVTAIGVVDNLLLACVGPKVVLHKWDKKYLEPCAFHDSQFYIVSAQTLKNFILLGDVQKGVYLLLWDPIIKELSLLGSDYANMELFACSFMADGRNLNFIAADSNTNVQLLRYLPDRAESFHGKRLLAQGDFHVGSHINKMIPLKLRTQYHNLSESNRLRSMGQGEFMSPDKQSQDADILVKKPLRTAMFAGTLDGNYMCFCPVEDNVYRRLYSLHTQMTFNVQHIAGLNPRAYRLLNRNGQAVAKSNYKKNIVDGRLMYNYLYLDQPTQIQLARNIGTTPQHIINNLLQIEHQLQMI